MRHECSTSAFFEIARPSTRTDFILISRVNARLRSPLAHLTLFPSALPDEGKFMHLLRARDN